MEDNLYKHIIPVVYFKNEYLKNEPVYVNTNQVKFFEETIFHSHEYIEISYVYSGSGRHQICDQTYPCAKGDIFIINKNIPHCFFKVPEHDKELVVKNLIFIPEFIYDKDYSTQNIMDLYNNFMSVIFSYENATIKTRLNYEQKEFYEIIYLLISNEISEKNQGYLNILCAELTVLLVKLIRFLELNKKENVLYNFSNAKAVEKALNYIHENYADNDLTIETISKLLYISKSSLSKIFKSTTGEYFSDYLRKVRLNEVCRLLRDTDCTNETIIELCGLKDIPTFYSIFKKYTGMTPKIYRSFEKKKGV